MSLKEENFAFTGADMAVACHNIASLVDHEAGFVDIDIFTFLILAQQQLDIAAAVTIKDTHNFLKLERLAIIVIKLGHEASKLSELLPIESLNHSFVYDAALLIDQETL